MDNSQPWTISNAPCILGQTLLTMDNSLNCGPWTPFYGTKVHFLSLPWTVKKKFFFCVFFFVVFFLLYFQLNLQFCETIFLGFPFDVYSLLSKAN